MCSYSFRTNAIEFVIRDSESTKMEESASGGTKEPRISKSYILNTCLSIYIYINHLFEGVLVKFASPSSVRNFVPRSCTCIFVHTSNIGLFQYDTTGEALPHTAEHSASETVHWAFQEESPIDRGTPSTRSSNHMVRQRNYSISMLVTILLAL